MKDDKASVKTSVGKENEPVTENTTKKKTKEEKPPTKVVVRRLPPSMTEEQFKMQVSPMPDYDYFYFVPADMSLMPNAFSRAYINFIDQNELFIFTQKFDGYVFVDSKGGEFPAVVEFAPFQRIPKNRPNRKKDAKVGTIEADPIYIAFKEQMETQNLEKKTAANVSKQHFFETSLTPDKKEEVSNTPLLDYIRNKRAERQRIREEKREEKRKKDLERRRAKEEQRRVKKDDETSVVKNPPSSPVNPNPKIKEAPLDNLEKKEHPLDDKVEKQNQMSKIPPPIQFTEKTSRANKDEQITNKVRQLVNFFSKSVSVTGKQECVKNIDSSMPNCVKHEDVEREIMKNLSVERGVTSNQLVTTKVLSPKKLTKLNSPLVTCNFKGSSENHPSFPTPVLESRGRPQVYVPRNTRSVMYARSNSDIVMRPVRVSTREKQEGEPGAQNFVKECEIIRPVRPIQVKIPVVQSNRRGYEGYSQTGRNSYGVRTPIRGNIPIGHDVRNECRMSAHQREKIDSNITVNTVEKEDKILVLKNPKKEDSPSVVKTKNCEVKSSSSDILKKNLQKVVDDVLGNTKVCSPKENVINKPKTFVRRGFSGSGDECQGQGFNSPNFYLPPRAFGCGIGEASNSKDKKYLCSKNMTNSKTPEHFTTFTGKTHLPASIPKKSLPLFSKKSASSSKSDGDIEEFETRHKVGGSVESIKRMPVCAFIVQKPYGTPRKPIVVERNS